MGNTYFFLDWVHVDKGRMEVTLDADRLSKSGKEFVERYEREWDIYRDFSGHGMKRLRIPFGIQIAVEKATKSAPWLEPDQPWEGSINWLTVIQEDGKFRCWYLVKFPKEDAADATRVMAGEQEMDFGGGAMCYAESEDGLHWVKPSLGIFTFGGAKTNNIVSPYGGSSAVFRDDSAPADERYKAFHWDRLHDVPEDTEPQFKYGLYGCLSPDGYHWTRLPEPLLRDFHDTHNVGCWDPTLKKYVAFVRGKLNGRAISRSETDDFRQWPAAQVVVCPTPMDSPADDYYTNGFTWYPDDPSVKFLFSAIYHHDSDLVDTRLATSPDGRLFNWVSYEPIVEPGRLGEWDSGAVYMCPNLVRLPDGTLAMPYRGEGETHNESFRLFYEDIESPARFAWAMWEEGRLAGIEAASQGEFFTQRVTYEGGHIEINARTKQVGSVEVELWEAVDRRGSKPVEGFTFDDHVPIRGDEIWTRCHWKGKENLSELEGKDLQLRIRLCSAKIFGYRFA